MLVYILSRGAQLYSTSRLYKAALKRKHNVRIIDHLECDLLIENGIFKVIYNNQVLIKPDLVIPRIGSSATVYGTAVVRQFQQMGVPVMNTATGIFNSRDKFRSMQLLTSYKLPIPSTYYSNDMQFADTIVNQKLGYPFIIKVLSGTQGVGVHLVDNKREAHYFFNHFHQTKTKIILQEFIKESSGKDIRVFVVGKKVVASMMRIANDGEFRSNIHRGGIGKCIQLTEKEKEMAVKAAQILGLEIAGVDILRSTKGPLIIEVNSSPGLEGIENVTKVEIAEEIIRHGEEKVKLSL